MKNQWTAANIEYIVFILQSFGTVLQIIGSIILVFYVKIKVKFQDDKRSVQLISKQHYEPGEESPMQYQQRIINEALNKKTKIGVIGFIVTLIGSLIMLASISVGYYYL